MAGAERTSLKGIHDPSSRSSLHLKADETPQFSPLKNKKEGKRKSNRQMINSDDPQDGGRRADTKERESEVPQFGASDNRVKATGYRTYTKNKQKVNNRFAIVSKYEAQMKGDMHLQENLLSQDRPASDTPATQQEARSKMLQFGNYSWSFVNIWKNIMNWVVRLVIKLKSLMNYNCVPRDSKVYYALQAGSSIDLNNEEFKVPVDHARSPLLDESFITKRALPRDYGGGRLAVKQSEKMNVGQTEIASRGFPMPATGSTTTLQTDSNLMQRQPADKSQPMMLLHTVICQLIILTKRKRLESLDGFLG